MNIASFDGYITNYVKWPEGYIPWHVELFRCDVDGYIPCYRDVTLKSSAPPLPQSACALICSELNAKLV